MIIGMILGVEILLAVIANMHYKLAFLLGGGILIVAVAMIRMEWMAPTLVISLFFMGVSLGGVTESTGGNIRIFHLIAAFLIVRWIYYALVTNQPRLIYQSAIVAPCLIIMLWAAMTILWSPDLRFALYRFVKLSLSIGGALIFISIIKHKSLERFVVWFWVLSGIAGGVVAYYSWFGAGTGLSDTWLAHQNIVSEMMNVVTFLSLGTAVLTRKSLYRWACIVTVLFALAVNANTGCRAGFVALVVAMLVFAVLGVFNSKAGRKFPVILTSIFVILFGIAGYLVSTLESLVIFASGRSVDLMNPMAAETFAWRMETFQTAFNIMYEYSAWIWGMGIGAWEYLQGVYMEYTWARFIHNFYINFFFQYGVIGIILLVWLFVTVFAPIVRTYRMYSDFRTRWFLNSLVAMYVGLAIHGLVSIEEVNSYIWILFATTSIYIEYLQDLHRKRLSLDSII